MINFKNLSIKNFLSYGESPTMIQLDDPGTTLITGNDLDNVSNGVSANGTGKSTWINALIYALYGKPLSNISLNNLVNNINKKNMMVIVEFEKNDKIYTVKRARKETGNGNYAKVFCRPTGCELIEKDHDVTPDSIGNINDFITDHLGIPYELFVRIVAFAATQQPFLDLPVRHASQANQSDIMEELFNLTQLSAKADAVKAEIKTTKQTLEIKTRHNVQLEKEHDRHNQQLTRANTRVDDWEVDNVSKLATLKAELTTLQKVPVKEQEQLHQQVTDTGKSLTEETAKQTVVEAEITEIGANFTVAKASFNSLIDTRDKIVKWKEDNTEKLITIKKRTGDLLSETVIVTQKALHEKIAILQETIKPLENNIRTEESVCKDATTEITKNESEIKILESARCPYCSQKLEDAVAEIKKCNEILCEQNDIIDAANSNVLYYRKKLTSAEDDIARTEKLIKYTINVLEDQEDAREDSITALEALLNARCPHGEFAAVVDMNAEAVKLQETITALKETIAVKGDVLLALDETISVLKTTITDCKSKITINTLDELYEIKNKISQCKLNIKSLTTQVNPYSDPLRELEDIKLEQIDMDVINELNKLITHQNYLVKLLTKKDSFIRKSLLTKNLTFLNQRLREYLSALGLPHKVEFTHEMTANISQFGRELDFGNLSSGQKARVNLALSFSFRDVLQTSHDTINICMLDEVLDVGLDAVGVQSAAKMLKLKASEEELSLFIISHREEVSNIFDNKMVVQMEKGFSSVLMEN